jgi:hypothetical protein
MTIGSFKGFHGNEPLETEPSLAEVPAGIDQRPLNSALHGRPVDDQELITPRRTEGHALNDSFESVAPPRRSAFDHSLESLHSSFAEERPASTHVPEAATLEEQDKALFKNALNDIAAKNRKDGWPFPTTRARVSLHIRGRSLTVPGVMKNLTQANQSKRDPRPVALNLTTQQNRKLRRDALVQLERERAKLDSGSEAQEEPAQGQLT